MMFSIKKSLVAACLMLTSLPATWGMFPDDESDEGIEVLAAHFSGGFIGGMTVSGLLAYHRPDMYYQTTLDHPHALKSMVLYGLLGGSCAIWWHLLYTVDMQPSKRGTTSLIHWIRGGLSGGLSSGFLWLLVASVVDKHRLGVLLGKPPLVPPGVGLEEVDSKISAPSGAHRYA